MWCHGWYLSGGASQSTVITAWEQARHWAVKNLHHVFLDLHILFISIIVISLFLCCSAKLSLSQPMSFAFFFQFSSSPHGGGWGPSERWSEWPQHKPSRREHVSLKPQTYHIHKKIPHLHFYFQGPCSSISHFSICKTLYLLESGSAMDCMGRRRKSDVLEISSANIKIFWYSQLYLQLL